MSADFLAVHVNRRLNPRAKGEEFRPASRAES